MQPGGLNKPNHLPACGLALNPPLSNTNYHVTELAKADLIVLVRQRAVRGATEHFYTLPEALPKVEAESLAAAEPIAA